MSRVPFPLSSRNASRRNMAHPPPPPPKPSHLTFDALIAGLPSRISSVPCPDQKQARYICCCRTSRDPVTCKCSDCQKMLSELNSPCPFSGRCIEPLAWQIESEPIRTQNLSPLFTLLPREIRDLVFQFALTDGATESFGALIKRSSDTFRAKGNPPVHDIAISLLTTCRAVYLETWSLPLSLNSCIIYELQNPLRKGVKLDNLFPWQLAQIQGLDICVQQAGLEGMALRHFLDEHSSIRTHDKLRGFYLAPSRYAVKNEMRFLGPRTAFNCVPLRSATDEIRHYLSHIVGEVTPPPKDFPWSSTMRIARSQPLTHLTLRIPRKNWWTWTDAPDAPEINQLGLDPSIGNGTAGTANRPTAGVMRALAQRRRAGDHIPPDRTKGWGHQIAQLTHLKTLELVLETFQEKRAQLDNVVEAAKTWRFELYDTDCELVSDGEVGMSSWSLNFGSSKEVKAGPWYRNATQYDVRTVRYVRRRVV